MAAEPSFAIKDNPDKQRFEVDLGDGSMAIAEYTIADGKIAFTHTEVPLAHEGQGIGTALIRFSLRSARDRNLQVIPICPFYVSYMKKHAEEQDLLDAASRERLGID